MRWHTLALIMLAFVLIACGAPGTAGSGNATPTRLVLNTPQTLPLATATPGQGATGSGQGGTSSGTAGGGGVVTEGPIPPTPSPLRGPVTISINDLRAGQTLYLAVGDTFTLDSSVTGQVQIGDTGIITRVSSAAQPEYTQGSYKAIAPGKTTLQITESPDCVNANPPCLAPGALLILRVEVQ